MEYSGETTATSRRGVLKGALALGGASALSACLDVVGDEPIPQGGDQSLPRQQFAWNDSLEHDDHGNIVLPEHHLFLYLTYAGENADAEHGHPTDTDRDTLNAALDTIERAYEWSNRGVVFDLAYSPAYFARFDESLPDDIDLPEPRPLSSLEDPTLDEQDALLHLASDRADALLAIEESLFAERDTDSPAGTLNDVDVDSRLSEVFEIDDRRTGFIGSGLPADKQDDVSGIPDNGPVPDESPLFMGFKAGFIGNQAPEEYVAFDSGPFEGGTTKQVAAIRQSLDKWYDENDHDKMVSLMFSPLLAESGAVEGVGENLGDHNGVDTEIYEQIRETAERFGRVGHTEKVARANHDSDGNTRLLRRHVESTDNDRASLHFATLQREISDFVDVREAMNGDDLTDGTAVQRREDNNGILRYLFTENRGNFLVPPRSLRAFPTPTGDE